MISCNAVVRELPPQAIAAVLIYWGCAPRACNPPARLLSRIPCPALIAVQGHPLVIWQARQQQLLVGDPPAGSAGLPALVEQAGDEPLAVLCLGRSAGTPKARFGLGWFVPAIKHRAPCCRW